MLDLRELYQENIIEVYTNELLVMGGVHFTPPIEGSDLSGGTVKFHVGYGLQTTPDVDRTGIVTADFKRGGTTVTATVDAPDTSSDALYIADIHQASDGQMAESTRATARAHMETFEAGYFAKVLEEGTNIGITDPIDETNLKSTFLTAKQMFKKAGVPEAQRFAFLNEEVETAFWNAEVSRNITLSGDAQSLRNGQVGKLLGFDIYVSGIMNSALVVGETPTDNFEMAFGHPRSIGSKQQIILMEADKDSSKVGVSKVDGISLKVNKVILAQGVLVKTSTIPVALSSGFTFNASDIETPVEETPVEKKINDMIGTELDTFAIENGIEFPTDITKVGDKKEFLIGLGYE